LRNNVGVTTSLRFWVAAESRSSIRQGDEGRLTADCFDLDADNTRMFTGALDDAGIEPADDLIAGGYRVEANSGGTVHIFVFPYLPHGEADCGCRDS